MSRVFWDSNLFIYLIEDYGTLSKLTVALAERMLGQNDQLYTSTLHLAKCSLIPSDGEMRPFAVNMKKSWNETRRLSLLIAR